MKNIPHSLFILTNRYRISEKIGEDKLLKLEKIHAFQKKNASNELDIFFLKKAEEVFSR